MSPAQTTADGINAFDVSLFDTVPADAAVLGDARFCAQATGDTGRIAFHDTQIVDNADGSLGLSLSTRLIASDTSVSALTRPAAQGPPVATEVNRG
jgi:hypothetical protein